MAGAPAGGAELFFERLCAAQARAGDAVLPVIRRNADRAERLRACGLLPAELPFRGVLDLVTPVRLRAALRRGAPEVVVAWMSRAARAVPRGPYLLIGRLGGTYDLRYFRRCDHLVGNTAGLVRWMVGRGWPAERVHHLPNFAPDFSDAIPAALPGRTVLALGRLHPNKAFDVLVRAMAGVPGARLLLAGEGPERARLAALAREVGVADRVEMPGWRADTGALLAAADVLAVPSRREPLGNTVLEAWSAGCPVVAADADGPAELIRPGEDGLLVPRDEPDALAGALRAVLEAPGVGERLAAAGRLRYRAEFTEVAVLARWRDTLGRLQEEARPCAA